MKGNNMLKKLGKSVKGLYESGKSIGRSARLGQMAAVGASLAVVAGETVAAPMDTAGVTTALADAKTDALAVGLLVIGFVAGVVVVGIIIGMIKRA
jgi:hypothetical protein